MDPLLPEFVEQVRRCAAAVRALVDSSAQPDDPIPWRERAHELGKFEASAKFLGLMRLMRLTRAVSLAASGGPMSEEGRSVLREMLDRIAHVLDHVQREQVEPKGDDDAVLEKLEGLLPSAQPTPAAASPELTTAGPEGADEEATLPKAAHGIVSVPVGTIRVGSRLRDLKPARVELLAQSIKEIGLRTPITVVVDQQGHTQLVCGLHRLAAVKAIGQNQIDCLVLEEEGLERKIWEIDENLARCDLTQLERDLHLARRKEIFDAWRAAQSGRNPPSSGGRGKTGFAYDTEQKTGLKKRRVNEAIRRANKISSRVQDAIRELPSADIAVELDALAELEEAEQMKAVATVKEGRATSFREARDRITGDTDARKTEMQIRRLKVAWMGANQGARTKFLKWVEECGDLSRQGKDDSPCGELGRGAA